MKKDILSVGIDIGTTTTSMIVSRLGISNTAASYRVPEVSITTKDIIYRSPLYLTPQKDRDLLDGEAIRSIIEKEYCAAGIRPDDVDTGAVNRKLGSDMADSVTGGGLHGKDLSKADVSVNIWAWLRAQETGKLVEVSCAIGDDQVDGVPYGEIVETAREYIHHLGGFKKFAEWGLVR